MRNVPSRPLWTVLRREEGPAYLSADNQPHLRGQQVEGKAEASKRLMVAKSYGRQLFSGAGGEPLRGFQMESSNDATFAVQSSGSIMAAFSASQRQLEDEDSASQNNDSEERRGLLARVKDSKDKPERLAKFLEELSTEGGSSLNSTCRSSRPTEEELSTEGGHSWETWESCSLTQASICVTLGSEERSQDTDSSEDGQETVCRVEDRAQAITLTEEILSGNYWISLEDRSAPLSYSSSSEEITSPCSYPTMSEDLPELEPLPESDAAWASEQRR